jgi:NAD(P)-dependent dehydrogenase (short-subunit alcohol dehydrogenase family)
MFGSEKSVKGVRAMTEKSAKHPFDLEGQVALVTGASQGLGEQFALMLAESGAKVIALARRTPIIDHPRIFSVSADVTDHDQLHSVLADQVTKLGGLNIVVANAGVLRPTPIESVTVDQWRDLYQLNVEGAAFTVKIALPFLKQAGGGRIVLLSSGSVYVGPPGLSGYVSSKMALIGLARTLAAELAPFNIGVNAITPGLVRTEGNSGPDIDQIESNIVSMQILNRPMVAEDLRTSLLYLVSPASAAVTGQTVNVDGGLARR